MTTPRANGQVKRVNRSFTKAILAICTHGDEFSWKDKLSEMVWGINNTIYATTRQVPFDLVFAYTGGAVVEDLVGSNEGGADMHTRRRSAKRSIDEQALKVKVRYDKRRKVATKYKRSDLVL